MEVESYSKSLDKNTKVLVEMSPWDNPLENPQGKIIMVVGLRGENDTEMKAILLEKVLNQVFQNQ